MNKLEALSVFKEWLPELELAARYNTSRQSYERYAAVEAILEPEGGMCDEVEMRFNALGDPKKALIVFSFSDGTIKEVKLTKWPASLCTACCPNYKAEETPRRLPATQFTLRILRARVLELTEGATPELVRNTDVLALIDEMMEEIPNAVND